MSETAAPALSRGKERLAVAVLAFSVFVVTVNVNLAGALMPFLRDDAMYRDLADGARQQALGALVWSTSAAGALAALLLGPMIDRVGRRPPLLLGGVLLALGLVVHVLAPGHAALVAARVLSGFGGGLLFSSASAAVADLVPYHRRAAAMGVFSLGLFLATPVGVTSGVLLAGRDPQAWRWAFALLLPLVLFAVFGLARTVPPGLGRSQQRVHQLEVLSVAGVTASLLSVMLYTGAFFTTVQYAADWLDRTRLLPKEQQWQLWVALGVSTSVGALFLPRLADRFGKRNIVLLTTGGVGVCLFLLGRAESLTAVVAVGLPLTMLAAARTPALQALMSEIVEPRMRGTLMGLRAAAVNAGAFGFAAAGNELYAARGYPAMATAAAVTMAVAYLLVRGFVKVEI